MLSPVVLVTGCSSGIGQALCEAFYARGLRVIATARRLEAIAHLQAKGMTTLTLDITKGEQIQQVVDYILQTEGRLDILVNNAGYGLFGPVLDLPQSAIADQFTTNVFAPVQMVQAVAPLMRSQGSGLILNIGSISGELTTPFAGAYCASKAALHALSDAMRLELAPFGIQVVTVQPGAIASNFGNNARESVGQSWNAESWYAPLAETIQARAHLSQYDATPAADFANRLVEKVLHPPISPNIRIGKKSLQFKLLKRLLPTSVLDSLLSRRFKLSEKRLSQGQKIEQS